MSGQERIRATMPGKMRGKSFLSEIDPFLAVKLAKNNKDCGICREPFIAGEILIERFCCHLVTHVSCLSQWANTTPIKRGFPLESPSRPQRKFSCPNCRRDALGTRYFKILDEAFPPNAK